MVRLLLICMEMRNILQELPAVAAVYVHVYVHEHAHVYLYIYDVDVYEYVHEHVYVCELVYVFVHVYEHVHEHVCMYTSSNTKMLKLDEKLDGASLSCTILSSSLFYFPS